jgi:formate hydrogenlyase subunit 6/NADH:ubiquinone oxidoreductase subunit I
MDIYNQLREVLDAHPSTAPKAKAIVEILQILFTTQEAAIAVFMSFKPKKPAHIAKKCSLTENETRKHLEAMADKGIIFSRNKDGGKLYGLVPLIPGIFEFPFMKGGGTPMHERLGKLWEEYHSEALGASFAGNPTPMMRVVPVEKSITAMDRIHSYEEVQNFINNASYIAVANCACRVSVAGCDRPKEVCLIFDTMAEFLVERGFARHISKDEGMRVLDMAEAAGLVHTSNNSSDKAVLICNCCPCCCTVLRGRTQLHHPHAFEPSGFTASVQSGKCTGCTLCTDRCPMKAIEIINDLASVRSAECIGCGLCVTACPTVAIELKAREPVPSIPATATEMGAKVLQEKGRLDAFLKIMQD